MTDGSGGVVAKGKRLDIQALRALAVVSVIWWHAGGPGLQGGFIGVDVFFVISGYLMVDLLHREYVRTGALRLRSFYLRRARRLLPPALIVLASTGLMVWLTWPPIQRTAVGWDIAASALYVVNFRLAGQSIDYLNNDAGQSPVLHYWSLAIEEQFYVVLPLTLLLALALLRRAPARGAMAVAVLAISVPSALICMVNAQDPSAADYFSTAGRLWELGLGGLAALLAPSVRPLAGAALNGVGVAAVGVIVASMVLIGPGVPFPGPVTLIPTVATAVLLIVGRGSGGATSPVLGSAPVQRLGDMSYSLYLWHMPVLLAADRLGGGWRTGAALIVVAGLGWVQWRLVETRYQNSKARPARQTTRTVVLLSSTSLAVVAGAALLAGPGAKDPSASSYVPALDAAIDDRFGAYYDGPCRPDGTDGELRTCQFGDPRGDVVVHVVGDSTAVMWMPAIQAIAEEEGWNLRLSAKLSCPVASGFDLGTAVARPCADWNQSLLAYLDAADADVVLVANAPRYDVPELSAADADARYAAAVEASLASLAADGRRVLMMGSSPRFEQSAPVCLSTTDDPARCGGDVEAVIPRTPPLEGAVAAQDVGVLDAHELLCEDRWCPVVRGRTLMYMDTLHLTRTYAESLAGPLLAEMTRAAGDVERLDASGRRSGPPHERRPPSRGPVER